MDSVQHRCDVHLRHLLIHSQVNPKLRPVNAWDSVSLWRYRRQRWRFVRPPLLQRYVQPPSASSVPLGAMGVPLDGAILFFCGYFLIWASVVGLIQRPVPVPLMCLFIFMAAQGQNFFNTTDVVTRLINFGDYGGTIVGIFKVYTCGSALFCQQIFFFLNYCFCFFIQRLINFIIFSSNWYSNSIPVLSRATLVWVEQCWSKSKCTKQYAWAIQALIFCFLHCFRLLCPFCLWVRFESMAQIHLMTGSTWMVSQLLRCSLMSISRSIQFVTTCSHFEQGSVWFRS